MGLLRGLAQRTITYQDVFGAALEDSPDVEWGAGGRRTTKLGRRVNSDTALSHAAVYACVRLISEIVAGLPVGTFRPDPVSETATERVRTPDFLSAWPAAQEFPRAETFERILASALLDGSGFAYLIRDNPAMIPLGMIPLPPKSVCVERPVSGGPIVYEVTLPDGSKITLQDWEVFHLPAFSTGGLRGLNPIAYFRETIGLGLAAEHFSAQWLDDGAAPSSILSTTETMDEAEAKRNQQAWIESHGGRRHPAFLSGGLKWEAITISPDDAAALDTEKWSVEQVARIYRVQPHLIGDLTHATFSNIEHQGIEFVRYTLRPWLNRMEQRLFRLIPGPRVVRFDTDDLERGDLTARLQSYSLGRQIGLWSANDLRSKEGESPIDDPAANDYSQPLNWGPLGADPVAGGTPTNSKPTTDPTGGAQA